MTHTVRTVLTSLVALTVLRSCSEDTESDGGAEIIEIQDADVAFELPAAWVELDPAEAREALTDDDLMAELVERHTGVGPAVLSAFSSSAREPVLHWAELTLDTGSDVMAISLVTDDRAKSEQLASDIADSLERTP